MIDFSSIKHYLLNQVEQTVHDFELIKPGMSILCAVSGGPDSTCLLVVCHYIRQKYNLKLAIGHVHHGLREKEADKDAIFVENLANMMNIPYYIDHVNVIEYKKENKLCLEEAARDLRYNALKKMCKKNGHHAIALGHNSDDTAEQILMNLLRGTGPQGLTGITPKRNIEPTKSNKSQNTSIQIIRPLIHQSRKNIICFLKDLNLSYVIDNSNQDTHFLRNRIRHSLLPILKSYNPNIKASLNRLADIQRTDHNWLETFSSSIFKTAIHKIDDENIILNQQILSENHLAVVRTLLRNAIFHVKGNLRRITHDHIKTLSKWVFLTNKSRYMYLPDNIYVKYDGKKIHFTKNLSKIKKKSFPKFLFCIKNTGKLLISERNMILDIDLISRDLVNITNESKNDPLIFKNNAYFDADVISFPLFVRNIEQGDRFQPLGMKGHQKLKKFFSSQKIPVPERARTAVLVSNEKIIWVIGYRISQFAAITPKTKHVLTCKYTTITDA